MKTNISSRALRCLKRIDQRKSIGDFDALEELEQKGLITQEAESSDDIETKITAEGRKVLELSK